MSDLFWIQPTTRLHCDALLFELGGTSFACNMMQTQRDHSGGYFHWGQRSYYDFSWETLLPSFRESLARHEGPLEVEYWRGTSGRWWQSHLLTMTLTGREISFPDGDLPAINGRIDKAILSCRASVKIPPSDFRTTGIRRYPSRGDCYLSVGDDGERISL